MNLKFKFVAGFKFAFGSNLGRFLGGSAVCWGLEGIKSSIADSLDQLRPRYDCKYKILERLCLGNKSGFRNFPNEDSDLT